MFWSYKTPWQKSTCEYICSSPWGRQLGTSQPTLHGPNYIPFLGAELKTCPSRQNHKKKRYTSDFLPVYGTNFINEVIRGVLNPLGRQSRFVDKPLKFQAVCPQNGTAVLNRLYVYNPTSSELLSVLRYISRYTYLPGRFSGLLLGL